MTHTISLSKLVAAVSLLVSLAPVAAQAQESVGRYEALTVPRASGEASLVLVDTATGRTWMLGTAPGDGGKTEPRWQPLRFLSPAGDQARPGDPLYPNATGDAGRR